jgi:hypothetical protein
VTEKIYDDELELINELATQHIQQSYSCKKNSVTFKLLMDSFLVGYHIGKRDGRFNELDLFHKYLTEANNLRRCLKDERRKFELEKQEVEKKMIDIESKTIRLLHLRDFVREKVTELRTLKKVLKEGFAIKQVEGPCDTTI